MPPMPNSHVACGVFVTCVHCGVWQPGLLMLVFRNTPPSLAKSDGHAPAVNRGSNRTSPTSLCAPFCESAHDDGVRAEPPCAGGVGVVAVLLNTLTSPNQTSNCVEFTRFVLTNGTRPCALPSGGVSEVGHVRPPSSDSQMLLPTRLGPPGVGFGRICVFAASRT